MQKAGVSFHKYSLIKSQIRMACPFNPLTAPISPSSISSLLVRKYDVWRYSNHLATLRTKTTHLRMVEQEGKRNWGP